MRRLLFRRDGVDVGGVGGERQLRALAAGGGDDRLEDLVDLANALEGLDRIERVEPFVGLVAIGLQTRSSIGGQPPSHSSESRKREFVVCLLMGPRNWQSRPAALLPCGDLHAQPARWRPGRGGSRLVAVDDPCSEDDLAGLTTHVLDVARGCPARASRGRTSRARGRQAAARSVADVWTNADGRTDAPLISAAEARAGPVRAPISCRRLFSPPGVKTADPPFLDVIPLRFAIADPEAHYHVPLLVSPWSYSTYRGS